MTPGVGDGQRGLACCNSWGYKESDTTEQLNRTELNITELTRQVKTHNDDTLKIRSYQHSAQVNCKGMEVTISMTAIPAVLVEGRWGMVTAMCSTAFDSY